MNALKAPISSKQHAFKRALTVLNIDELFMMMTFRDGICWLLSSSEDLPLKSIIAKPDDSNVVDMTSRLLQEAVAPTLFSKHASWLDEHLTGTGFSCAQTIHRTCLECEFIFIGLQADGHRRTPSDDLVAFEQQCYEFVLEQTACLQGLKADYQEALVLRFPNCLYNVICRTENAAFALTAREKQCLTMALGGKETSDIAAALGISISGVYFHYKHIKNKLSCHNIEEAAVMAMMLGELGFLNRKWH